MEYFTLQYEEKREGKLSTLISLQKTGQYAENF